MPASSRAEISTSSTPNPCIQAASRRSASCRCGLVASDRCPTGRNPVECPVSASSLVYRSREYRLKNSAVSSVIPAEVISPAACQVVPAVSRCCSSSTTSVQPSWARW